MVLKGFAADADAATAATGHWTNCATQRFLKDWHVRCDQGFSFYYLLLFFIFDLNTAFCPEITFTISINFFTSPTFVYSLNITNFDYIILNSQ